MIFATIHPIKKAIFYFVIIFVIPTLFVGLSELALGWFDYPLFVEEEQNSHILNLQSCRYGMRDVDKHCKMGHLMLTDSSYDNF